MGKSEIDVDVGKAAAEGAAAARRGHEALNRVLRSQPARPAPPPTATEEAARRGHGPGGKPLPKG
jgi:hypothetical protein